MSVGVSWKLVFKSSDMYIIVDGWREIQPICILANYLSGSLANDRNLYLLSCSTNLKLPYNENISDMFFFFQTHPN